MSMLYSGDTAAARRRRLEQHQNIYQQLLSKRQGLDSSYQAGTDSLNAQKPGAFRKLLNSFASRGAAYSSGYGQEVTNTTNQFANQQSALDSSRTAGYADTDYQQADEDSSFQYDLSDLAGQQASWEAQQQQQTAALTQQQALVQAQINAANAKAVAASGHGGTITKSLGTVPKKVIKKK